MTTSNTVNAVNEVSDTLTLVHSAPTIRSVPSISSSAMLVELNISNWSGRKKDRAASGEITTSSQAEAGVASVTKKLLGNSKELKDIQNFINSARTIHTEMTMPWSNSGLRLLPTTFYFKYNERMSAAIGEFNTLVSVFLTSYSYEVARSQVKLGNLFNIDDYPTPESLQAKFGFHLNYLPLPDAGDFRIDVGNDAAAELRRDYEKLYADQYNNAIKSIWNRVYGALAHMSERLDYTDIADRKIFHGALVSNVADMIGLLRSCNLNNDSQMSAMADQLESALSGVTPDGLRADNHLRIETKRKVDAAIAALPSLNI